MIVDSKFLALDLELNQPSGKIIQVGVAIGDKNTRFEDYIVRKWYIDPQEPISEFINDLTGITDADIRAESYSHEYVARELSELIREYKCFINPVTWGGGDSSELLAEFAKNQVDFPHFGRRWIDVKTWYTYLMLTKGKQPSGGLASAMGYFKLHFKGKAHRADVDAANTLALFFKLLERQAKLESILDSAKNI
jgi:inhibitor of KinA sporulation pathway (predicted exonuclease)